MFKVGDLVRFKLGTPHIGMMTEIRLRPAYTDGDMLVLSVRKKDILVKYTQRTYSLDDLTQTLPVEWVELSYQEVKYNPNQMVSDEDDL